MCDYELLIVILMILGIIVSIQLKIKSVIDLFVFVTFCYIKLNVMNFS